MNSICRVSHMTSANICRWDTEKNEEGPWTWQIVPAEWTEQAQMVPEGQRPSPTDGGAGRATTSSWTLSRIVVLLPNWPYRSVHITTAIVRLVGPVLNHTSRGRGREDNVGVTALEGSVPGSYERHCLFKVPWTILACSSISCTVHLAYC